MDESHVEWASEGGGVVYEEGEVGVEEEEEEDALEDCGYEEPLEDECDCPACHYKVGEDEGEADCFC